MPPPRRQTPLLYRRTFAFSYSFVAGVGAVLVGARTWGRPVPIEAAWVLYALAACAAVATAFLWRRDAAIRAEAAPLLEGPVGLLDLEDRETAAARVARAGRLVTLLLAATAVLLGAARYVHRAHIPAFVDDPERPQHTASILRAIRPGAVVAIRGRIVAEPEAWPASRGRLDLVIEPYEIVPDVDRGTAYAVSEGNVGVQFQPNERTLEKEDEVPDLFRTLSRGAAYADLLEVTATLSPACGEWVPASMNLPQGAANPGAFDAEAFYSDQDIYAQVRVTGWDRRRPPIQVLEEAWGLRILGIPGSEYVDPFTPAIALKEAMLRVIKKTIAHPESAFLAGVTLGLRRGLEGMRCPFEEVPERGMDRRLDVLQEFRWSGTSHVLAVSGLHVTIIAVFLTAIFEGCRVSRRIYAPFVCLALFIFCLITGARPSAIRATIMNSLVVLTYAYGGRGLRASLLLSIGVAATVILLDNPKWLLQPAFSLSFMAVLALGLFTGPFGVVLRALAARFIHPWWRPIRLPLYEAVPALGRVLPTVGNYLRDFAGAQLAIMFGMMFPLSLYYFTRFSVAGPFANFFAIPLIGVIVQLGILGSIIGLVPVAGPYLVLPLGAANWLLCRFFLWTAHASTYMPFPWVQTLEGRHLVLYYAALGLFAFRRPLLDRIRLARIEARLSPDAAALRRFRWKMTLWIAAAAAGVAACLVRLPDRRLEVTLLSFPWQPETAIHIKTPAGRNILVDAGRFEIAGPDDAGSFWTTGQYLLKRRIDRLDLVVAASLRPEDVTGLVPILRVFPVDRFVAPVDLSGIGADGTLDHAEAAARLVDAGVIADPDESRRGQPASIRRTVEALGLAANGPWDLRRWGQALALAPSWIVRSVRKGPRPAFERAERGAVIYEEGDLSITVLHPPPPGEGLSGYDRSLVLKIDHGDVSILLAHGIGEAGAAEVARLPDARADVVVLPAHGGAAEPIPAAFLDRVAPAAAIAAYRCGGAPSARRAAEARFAAAVEDLGGRGVAVYRTDRDGAVRIFSDGASYEIRRTLGRPGEGVIEETYTEF